jgi:hypothetical protein
MIIYFITGVLAILLGLKLLNERGDFTPLLGIPLIMCGIASTIYGLLPLLTVLN